MSDIIWLDQADGLLHELGGKGASLVALRQGGFRVPPGFCVRASAYRAFVVANDLSGAIADLLAVENLQMPKVAREACAALSPLLETATLQEPLAAEIVDSYDHLRGQTTEPFVAAVRSSALSEDAAGASSAGLYDTYLNLRDRAAVLEGVLLCYRSLWSQRAVQYRAFKHVDSSAEAMAVVVMQMVPSDVSGVAFTINPVSGDRGQITINASWGLGEAVVSGRVTPDQFLIDKASLAVVARDISSKEIAILPTPGGMSGTITSEIPPDRADAPALSDDELQELAAECLRVERYFDRPMDIEWAIAGGELFILQARPVTGL